MANYLVSIVGNQTLPNILPIKEFESRMDKYIFIYTGKVRSELTWIKKVCNLTNDVVIDLKVHEDDLNDINIKLSTMNSILSDSDNVFVNLTGGTKIMALGTFEYFTKIISKTNMFYLNMGSNVLRQVYPVVDEERRDTKIEYRVNVKEFLGAYGTEINNFNDVNSLCKDKEYTELFYKNKWSQKYNRIISKLRDYINEFEKDILFDRTKEELLNEIQVFISVTSFPLKNHDRLTKNEIRYLIGGWWEEYCYNYIKEKFALSDSYINIGIQNSKTNNELDVIFVKDNVLYVFECKTTVFKKDDFEDYIYKLSAIKDNQNGFGIGVKAYLVTNRFKSVAGTKGIDPTFKRRASAFNITLVDAKVLDRGNLAI